MNVNAEKVAIGLIPFALMEYLECYSIQVGGDWVATESILVVGVGCMVEGDWSDGGIEGGIEDEIEDGAGVGLVASDASDVDAAPGDAGAVTDVSDYEDVHGDDDGDEEQVLGDAASDGPVVHVLHAVHDKGYMVDGHIQREAGDDRERVYAVVVDCGSIAVVASGIAAQYRAAGTVADSGIVGGSVDMAGMGDRHSDSDSDAGAGAAAGVDECIADQRGLI